MIRSLSKAEAMPAVPLKLSLRGVHKSFAAKGSSLRVLDGVDIDVAQGGFVSVIGPSGCGKTTVFNIIAGLLKPRRGHRWRSTACRSTICAAGSAT